jgi:hypothetical protein
MKFPVRIDAIWRAPLLANGVTQGNSYVTLNEEGVHFRFGPLFNRTVPYTQVANVFPRSWPVLYGIGLRSNLRGVIGLIGSYHDVVEVRLTKRIRNWVLLFPCDRISVSLEEPERFVEELARRIGVEPEQTEPLAKPRRAPKTPKRAAAKREEETEPQAAADGQSGAGSAQARGFAAETASRDESAKSPARAPKPGRGKVKAAPKPKPRAKKQQAPAGSSATPKRERRAPTTPTTNGRGSAKPGARTKQARQRRPRGS